MINYNGKIFSPINNDEGEGYSAETFFVFRQTGIILTSNYSGGAIIRGQILALVDEEGSMKMSFHHVTTDLALITGTGKFIPEILPNGKIMLLQKWNLINGDLAEKKLLLFEH